MAIGLFKLSKKQRSLLYTLFLSLNLIQILTGVIMIILSLYINISIAPVLYSERSELNYVFTVIAFCGVNNCFNYLFGVRIGQKCVKQSHKKSTRTLIFAWSCVSFYIIFYLFILAIMSRKIYKHVIRSMKHSLHIGMTHYLKDALWKLTIDRLQYDMQCCGIRSHKEWHEIEWLEGGLHYNERSDTVKKYLNGSRVPVTPWSCCRLDVPMQCFHDPLQQTRANVWGAAQPADAALATINPGGCIDKLRLPVQSAFTAFILLVALNCFLQAAIFILLRLLYTSMRNAVLLNDPEGVAPGWVFGRGDCGYNRGKTVAEIMALRKTVRRRELAKKKEERPLMDTTDNEREQ